MKILWLLALLCALLAVPLSAQVTKEFPSTSGNAFVRFCSGIDKDEKTNLEIQHVWGCVAYVEGVTQGVSEEVDFAHVFGGKEPLRPFCLPAASENGQIVRIVLKYIGNNPEEAHNSTSFLIVAALRDAFPCPVKTPAKKQ